MDIFKKVMFRAVPVLFFVGIVLAASSFFTLRSQMFSYSHLATLLEGNGVCFSRVIQTFTARMIKESSSEYLTPRFIDMTGECYGDLLDNFHRPFANISNGGSQINRMASDVHWFHQRLKMKVIGPDGQLPNTSVLLQNQFGKLESLNGEVNKILENQKALTLKKFTFYTRILLVSLLFLFMAIIKYFVSEFSLGSFRRTLEKKVKEIKDKELMTFPFQVEKLISDVLKKHGYVGCAKIFARYHEGLLEGKPEGFKIKQAKTVNPISHTESSLPRAPQKTIGATSIREKNKKEISIMERDQLQQIRLASLIEQVFLRLNQKIYGYGVYVDIEVSENLFIWAKPDAIFQVIYDLLTTQLREVMKTAEKPNIMIQGRGIGGMIILNLAHNGAPYNKKLISNIKKKGQRNGLPPELLIAKELLKESGEKIQLINTVYPLKKKRREEEDKEILPQIRLSLKRAYKQKELQIEETSQSHKTIQRLITGTKRTLLKEIRPQRPPSH